MKLSEEKSQNLDKLNNLSKETEELSLKSKYIERDRVSITSKLEDLISSHESLMKKCPGSNEEILSKTEYIAELRSKSNSVKESEIKISTLQDEVSVILEKKYNNSREMAVLSEKLEVNKKEISDLEKEIDKLKYLNLALELRKELKENMPCPVCGSRHHEKIEILSKDDEIDFLKGKLEKLNGVDKLYRLNLEEFQLKKW